LSTPLPSTLDVLRTFVVSRLTNIRKLIAHPESVDQAEAALREHFGSFTLEPVTQAGKTTYLAHGKVDFFGDQAMARRVVPGARIELATPAFSGRRSTNELPRLLRTF
jgi:hypothetical protein